MTEGEKNLIDVARRWRHSRTRCMCRSTDVLEAAVDELELDVNRPEAAPAGLPSRCCTPYEGEPCAS
jgi:hypothetical protein